MPVGTRGKSSQALRDWLLYKAAVFRDWLAVTHRPHPTCACGRAQGQLVRALVPLLLAVAKCLTEAAAGRRGWFGLMVGGWVHRGSEGKSAEAPRRVVTETCSMACFHISRARSREIRAGSWVRTQPPETEVQGPMPASQASQPPQTGPESGDQVCMSPGRHLGINPLPTGNIREKGLCTLAVQNSTLVLLGKGFINE